MRQSYTIEYEGKHGLRGNYKVEATSKGEAVTKFHRETDRFTEAEDGGEHNYEVLHCSPTNQ